MSTPIPPFPSFSYPMEGDDEELERLKRKIEKDRGFNCQFYKEKCLRRRIAGGEQQQRIEGGLRAKGAALPAAAGLRGARFPAQQRRQQERAQRARSQKGGRHFPPEREEKAAERRHNKQGKAEAVNPLGPSRASVRSRLHYSWQRQR